MLKGQVTKIIAETTQGVEGGDQLTREEKFQVFCNVCDNLLKEGRISSAKHYAWTNVF
jgi:hypothetical protein